MAYQLTRKLRELTPYAPIQGEFVVRLDANESFISLPDDIRAEIANAAASIAFNRYPDPYAKELCGAFAKFYGINSELVTAFNGSDELICLIMNSFFEKGDRVLTLAPDFSMYKFYISLAELECVTYSKSDNLTVNVDDLIAYINENNIAGVIFSNPCNPASLGLGRDEVLHLVSSVNCLVILDEAYMDFWDCSIMDRVEEFPHLVILRTCSKAIGLAAARLGFAVSGATNTNGLRAAKSPYNVSTLDQVAGTVVLRHKDYLMDCIEKIKASRECLYKSILELKERKAEILCVYAPVTNFVFFKTTRNKEIFEKLLSKGIAIRYMGEYLRISAGSETENAAVLAALEEIL
ncbi:MAG: histidinol-phosphate aminotransferase family protein [Oscillospiraceae bacterium]|nr:histidinol-phosphate aminotransferase family protein [Oscillospiraceae bacterium]